MKIYPNLVGKFSKNAFTRPVHLIEGSPGGHHNYHDVAWFFFDRVSCKWLI